MKREPREESPTPAAESTPSAARTRRSFMKLMAVGSTAVLVGGSARRAGAATAKKKPAKAAKPDTTTTTPAKPGAHPALAEEIEKQKKSTLDSLKKIRDYSLPPGSPQGFAFRPLPANRKPRRAH